MYCLCCGREDRDEADADRFVFIEQGRYETKYACPECAPETPRVILDTDYPEEL